jgi:type VI secretion system protein ImpG
MDPRLKDYYNRELKFIHEMGGEFAKEFPKIAARLGMDGFECADPYVERLLEGFAFLAARVQLKLDAESPHFTHHLLQMVYPHYLTPTPSMAVVQLAPDFAEGALAEGFPVPAGSVLRSQLGKGDQTPCEFRTAHEVKLWPLTIEAAEFRRDALSLGVPERPGVKSAFCLTLKTAGGVPFQKLALQELPVFLRGGDEVAGQLYELLLASAKAVVVRPAVRPAPWQVVLETSELQRLGFADDEALLPYGPRSFQGYRLLQEYFAFPERFLFLLFGGLEQPVRRCEQDSLEIIVLLDRTHSTLDKVLDKNHFTLFCTPATNLFPKRADRIHLDDRDHEHHVVPDRTRPMDFEVYQITDVTGHGSSADAEQPFLPFYSVNDLTSHRDDRAYYTVAREPRLLSSKQRNFGARSSYVGSEVFLSLVDSQESPFHHDLRQLSVQTLCTNRDLPLQMPIGQGRTDFSMESGAPVQSVRCVAGPTRPRPFHVAGEQCWRLISHLSLNYLSLLDSDQRQGAAALRDLLSLYVPEHEAHLERQVEGVKSVTARPVMRRMPGRGPITFARGMEIHLTLDDRAFEGLGMFVLGAVLEQFFRKYVSINSFTETVVKTIDRGEVIRWPTRIGRRHIL